MSTIADFHTLQTISAHTQAFPAYSFFTRRFLVTASNNGYSSASVLKSSLNGRLLYRTDFGCPSCFPYNSSAWTEQKTLFPAVPLLLRVDSLLQELVYRAIA
jgi:hypothetical protein